jgi:hypothetical protein
VTGFLQRTLDKLLILFLKFVIVGSGEGNVDVNGEND